MQPLPRPRQALATSLALALAVCATAGPSAAEVAPSNVPPAAAPTAAPELRSLSFVGVEALDVSALRRRMRTRPRPWWKRWADRPRLDEVVLRDDMERLVALYRTRGYYEARATYTIRERGRGGSADVEVRVDEGPPVVLVQWSLELRGDAVQLDAAALRAELGLREGALFDTERCRSARAELLRRLADAGFPDASLAGGAEVELATRSARVRWTLAPGPPVYFGDVRITGNEEIADHVVRRELGFAEGERFSDAALRASQRAIYDLGLFRAVALKPLRDEAQAEPREGEPDAERWPIAVEVQERPPRSIRLSGGFGTEDGPRARLGWQHRNFLGNARDLELSARYSTLRTAVETELAQAHFLRPKLRLEARAFGSLENLPAYEATLFGVDTTVFQPFTERWTGRLGYRFALGRVTEFEVDADAPESSRLSGFELGARRVELDDPLDPTTGSWLDVSLAPTLAVLGSDTSYLTALGEVRHFFPLPGKTVLALRLRAGTIEPLAGDDEDDVPLFERFYAGGSASVRGFDLDELGPLDDGGDPLGGSTLVEGSAELRFPIWRELGGVVFADAGQVARDAHRFRAADVRYSSGAGLRYRTPIGPLRLDLGYVLNPPEEADRFRVHFSIGHAF